MKRCLAVLFCLALFSFPAFADKHKTKDKDHDQQANDQRGNNGNDDGKDPNSFASPGGFGKLRDHGGPVMTNAKVVFIFWGWAPGPPASEPLLAPRRSGRPTPSSPGDRSERRRVVADCDRVRRFVERTVGMTWLMNRKSQVSVF